MRTLQHSEPLKAILPDGKEVYFSNISEATRRYGLTCREIRDLLATGEAYHVKQHTYGKKPSKRLQADGVRFGYIID